MNHFIALTLNAQSEYQSFNINIKHMSLSLLESHVIENKRVDSFSVRILLLLDYLYIGSFPGTHRALVTGNHLDSGVCHPSCVTRSQMRCRQFISPNSVWWLRVMSVVTRDNDRKIMIVFDIDMMRLQKK